VYSYCGPVVVILCFDILVGEYQRTHMHVVMSK
jgi:hypothetical protein